MGMVAWLALVAIAGTVCLVIGLKATLSYKFGFDPVRLCKQTAPRRTHNEKPTPTTILVSHHNDGVVGAAYNGGGGGSCEAKLLVEKPVTTETIVKVVTMNMKVKKSPSTPSLFFIDERIGRKEEEEENETINGADDLGAQELFVKAEGFIGNCYKQLKMQREESWRKIHGLYQRPV